MINDAKHATAVQTKRAKAGKRGYAKAVRRFIKRDKRFDMKKSLPVDWAKPAVVAPVRIGRKASEVE